MGATVDVASLRKEYLLNGLYRKDLKENPFDQFNLWFAGSVETAGDREPNAMTLATASKQGIPSARVVLLKGVDGRGFVFFTSYESRKARHLAENPNAALNFNWPWLERQIQIEGIVAKVSRAESEEYFAKRPIGSRFGAIASNQSSVIASRERLEEQLREVRNKYEGKEPPAPKNWGGYRLVPTRFEFWQGRENRLHDRFLYTRQPDGSWRIDRLSP
jgi:pyridoxamine 5'-phosphate oxidase